MRVGVAVTEYNELTPHELNLHIQIYNERMTLEGKERLTTAYLTAAWSRVKKLPDLKKILGEDKAKKNQTPEQMLKVIRQLNAAFGGKEVKREIGK